MIFLSGSTLIPPPVRDLENALRHRAVPSGHRYGLLWALYALLQSLPQPSDTVGCPRGFSSSPAATGDPSKKHESYILFFLLHSSHTSNAKICTY